MLITFNAKMNTTTFRYEMLHGKEYLVCPMVMLTEGVHKGTQGAGLYKGEVFSQQPAIWNMKPIVIYHPFKPITATDPSVLRSQGVGFIMNAKWDGKLKAEAWLDEARLQEVDPRIQMAIEQNLPMELSTGVFVDKEDAPGVWNGTGAAEEYQWVARNPRPDHLALLPDQVGACSMADGAGFLVANAAEALQMGRFKAQAIETAMTRRKSQLVGNAVSYANKSSTLRELLRARFGAELWLEDVYDSFVVFEREGVLLKIDYAMSGDVITLSDSEPTPVVRVTEYRTVNGAYVGNQFEGVFNRFQQPKEENMTRQDAITEMVRNSRVVEADRAHLLGLPDALFERLFHANTPATPVTNTTSEPANSLDALLKLASPALAQLVGADIATAKAVRDGVIAIIVNNSASRFTAQDLEGYSTPHLQRMAELLVPVTNAAPQQQAPVTNAAPQQQARYATAAPVANAAPQQAPLGPVTYTF